MRLETISLSGYRSIEPSKPVVLADLGHINVFIGPNNCGKSSIFRFLQTLALLTGRGTFSLQSTLSADVVDDSWWWAQARGHSIEALLVFSGQPTYDLDPKLPGRLDDGARWKLKVRLTPTEKGACSLVVAPQLWIHDEWRDLVSFDGIRTTHLNANGETVSSTASDNCPYDESATAIIRVWGSQVRFFDPVRALDRGAGRRAMIDGSTLLKELAEEQQDTRRARDYETFRSSLVDRLNRLIFDPVGMKPIRSIEIKGSSEKKDLDLFLTHDAGGPVVSLEHMGTGIAELVVLLATLLREKDSQKTYFLEEPETHLHPALVRRVLRDLQTVERRQFFLSTHSNVLLDALTSNDRVYHFTRRLDAGTEARRCDVITERHDVLDDLGVSGSTLLQANCVIWVEGPSDRVYLAKWLTTAASDLTEGSDYVFSFYGGRILSHFAFDDQDGLISLIKVSRFSAVLMDRDVSPDEDQSALRETKRRIQAEAEADRGHRLAILTEGREIENDLGAGVLGRAIGVVVPTHAAAWQTFEADGTEPFTRQAALHALAGAKENEREQLAKRLRQKKVDIARAAVATGLVASPTYVQSLVAFIRKSRTD
jgi:hypothetical protein